MLERCKDTVVVDMNKHQKQQPAYLLMPLHALPFKLINALLKREEKGEERE